METDIKKYFNFDWLATRKQFWMFQLLMFVVFFGIGFGQGFTDPYDLTFGPWDAINLGVSLAVFIPHIAINKARLNDAGWSGWWQLFPILNIVVMGFFKTKEDDNKYAMKLHVVGQA